MNRLSCGAVHVAPINGPWPPSDGNPGRFSGGREKGDDVADNGGADSGASGDGTELAAFSARDSSGDGPSDVGSVVSGRARVGDICGDANGLSGWPASGADGSGTGA